MAVTSVALFSGLLTFGLLLRERWEDGVAADQPSPVDAVGWDAPFPDPPSHRAHMLAGKRGKLLRGDEERDALYCLHFKLLSLLFGCGILLGAAETVSDMRLSRSNARGLDSADGYYFRCEMFRHVN